MIYKTSKIILTSNFFRSEHDGRVVPDKLLQVDEYLLGQRQPVPNVPSSHLRCSGFEDALVNMLLRQSRLRKMRTLSIAQNEPTQLNTSISAAHHNQQSIANICTRCEQGDLRAGASLSSWKCT